MAPGTTTAEGRDLGWLADAGLTPPVLYSLVDVDAALWSGSFDPVLMELVRLRLAQILQVDAELARRTPEAVAAHLDESLVDALAQWPTSPHFDERTRAALQWSEQWVIDVHGITDADAAHLQALFTARELAGLTLAVAIFEMLLRARVALGA